MTDFERFVKLLEEEVPIKILYKDESFWMKTLHIFMRFFNPTFMTDFTTTIGYNIYFPSKTFIAENENVALRILAHEAVHLLDAKRYSRFLFAFLYLFPQNMGLGVLAFPLLGWWASIFLVFFLPIPASFRYYFETRGYLMNMITHPFPSPERYIHYFIGWDYYKMYPFKKAVHQKLLYWQQKLENGEDEVLVKVWKMYKEVKCEN
jgi:hypothetical protein